MGILIKSTKDSKIVYKDLSGDDIEASSVYARVYAQIHPDGRRINGGFQLYLSEKAFKNGATPIQTSISSAEFEGSVGEGEIQSSETACKIAMIGLEKEGFKTEIL